MRRNEASNPSRLAYIAIFAAVLVGLFAGCRYRTGGGGGGGGTSGGQPTDAGSDAEDDGGGGGDGQPDGTTNCDDINLCVDGDGCCPPGCTPDNDNDCGESTCGNGTIEDGETCDGNCPTACDDQDPCTEDRLEGSAEECTARCVYEPITTCASGDGCCPASCDSTTDSDCSDSCGNGVVDEGETCDGNCPTNCDDGDACTEDQLIGSAANCTAECTYNSITSCIDGDGCCPSGCTGSNDSDCSTNSVVGDSCTSGSDCGSGFNCAQAPVTDGYCTANCSSDSDCPGDARCGFENRDGEGFCLEECTSDTDCGRSEYGCFDADGTGSDVCWAKGTGFGDIGDSCSSYSECDHGEGGFCISEGNSFKDGYCSERYCSSSSACPSGSHCYNASSGSGVCLEDCSGDFDCRSGYDCYDRDQDGTDECFPSGTGSKSIGDSCNGTWECGSGEWAFCIPSSNWPSGYCSELCGSGEGSCPSGSTCQTLGSGSSQQDVCLEDCSSNSDCRSSYTCASIGSGSQSVCAPSP